MVSAAQVEKISATLRIRDWMHVPGAAGTMIVSPDGGTTLRAQDMRETSVFSISAMLATKGASGGITKIEIVASTTPDMAGNLTVVRDSGTIAASAIGDWAFLECSEADLAQLSTNAGLSTHLRYAAGRITVADVDTVSVAYVSIPERLHRNITPPTTIA